MDGLANRIEVLAFLWYMYGSPEVAQQMMACLEKMNILGADRMKKDLLDEFHWKPSDVTALRCLLGLEEFPLANQAN